ncbi:MAG: polyhydroxyalkanoic acid system family protein [Methylophilaceae bacterium]|nr:polyhydroxyalkanoic acid system family protein [Methylophilaceae bacterium]
MATIDISRPHTLGLEAAKRAAEWIAERMQNELKARYRWQGNDLEFDCPGASGRICVGKDTVRVEVHLSLLLRPLRNRIEQEILRHLEEALG